jgi:AraC family transcriptional regulator
MTGPIECMDVLRAIFGAPGLRLKGCIGMGIPHSFAFAEAKVQSGECIKPGGVRHHLLTFQLNGGRVHRLDRRGARRDVGRAGLTSVLPAQALSRWKTDSRACTLTFAVSHDFLAALAEACAQDGSKLEIREESFVPDFTISNLVPVIRHQLLLARHPMAVEIDALANLVGMHLIRSYSNLAGRVVDHDAERLSATQRRRAIDFMYENLDTNLGLGDIANALGMTQYRFARAFRNATGASVHQSLVDMRINRARELLSRTAHPLAEIAYACGFSSQSHMTSWFRRRHGLTPKQFRQSVEA